ncbi:methyltransferase [Ruania suaedae]|nr:methyltransferase [Ruania suaedae]UFU04718.1 methyltransferase [Ruania suaedae]
MASIREAFDAFAPHMRRRPDVEAHDLVAADVSDRLILESAGLDRPEFAHEGSPSREAGRPEHPDTPPATSRVGSLVVVGDRYGALALPLAAVGLRVLVHQDALSGERAARLNAVAVGLAQASDADSIAVPGVSWHPLDAELFAGATLVLMQLPRSLGALDEIAGLIAGHADPAVRVVAGGRVKHMTSAMNGVLARHFATVTADRGVGKSRVLRASEPRAGTGESAARAWPRAERDQETGLTICAHGAAFAGAGVDIGTRLLLSVLDQAPEASRVIDLGCGTGVLAVSYARAHPAARVIATDQSAAAVASASATAMANDVAAPCESAPHAPFGPHGVVVVRDDGLGGQSDASADLILLNPPFHSGAAVTGRIAPRLFADAARVLRPGGELWCVWNSHLRYRPQLEASVGTTRQIVRDPKFTVTASVRT